MITLGDGTRIEDEIAVADAHPNGAHPFGRDDYLAKFCALAEPIVAVGEAERFLESVVGLRDIPGGGLGALALEVAAEIRDPMPPRPGLFEISG